MRYSKNITLALLFSCLSIFMASLDVSASELIGPQKIIEDSSNQIKVQMQDRAFTQDFKKVTEFIRSVINPHADFDLISSLVLGKFWKAATPSEQESFKKEFQTLLIRSYSRGFVEFRDWSIKYFPVNTEGDERKVLVKTQILQPGLQAVAVDYRMFLVKGEWKVYDILIDGVSLVTTYRSSFKNDIERTGSLQEVINQLIKRNVEAFADKQR
ncbi:MAG: ABC transporter substrate-binding protein [Methylococcaceae bacterium]|nr:ABC transporter substrate-binding protein [Methylococcaceae bacterium]